MDKTAFDLSPKQREIKEKARAFGEKWAPLAAEIDVSDKAPREEMIKDHIEMGLAGITIPAKYGGQDLNCIEFALAIEEASRGMKSWYAGDILFGTTCTGPTVVMASDDEALKNKYLPPLARGEKSAAIAMTEPKYGSAVTDLETSAVLDGDHYILNGTKRFITGAPEYDLYATFVRFKGIPGSKGIGAVLVEKGAPGLTMEEGKQVLGGRGGPHGTLYFNDCRIPKQNLILREGKFGKLMLAFNMERLYIASLCLGLAEASLDTAIDYSNKREQFGKPVNEFQSIYHLIAEMWTEIESARYSVYMAALTAEEGKFPKPLEVSTAKYIAANISRDVSFKAMQILGGDGVVMDTSPQRCFRDAILSATTGGTMQVLKNVIATLVLGKRFDQRK